MVHTFTALGQYLVADVNSGAVHVLDPMSYDLLSRVEGEEKLGEHCPQDLLEELSQYDPSELEETWQELRALQEQGLLFSSDDYLDPEAAMALPRQAVVKALCLHVSHDCNLRSCASTCPTTATCAAGTASPAPATSAPATG